MSMQLYQGRDASQTVGAVYDTRWARKRLRKAYEMKSVSLDRWRDCVVDLRHVGDEF
jgi:hypothetical protein